MELEVRPPKIAPIASKTSVFCPVGVFSIFIWKNALASGHSVSVSVLRKTIIFCLVRDTIKLGLLPVHMQEGLTRIPSSSAITSVTRMFIQQEVPGPHK